MKGNICVSDSQNKQHLFPNTHKVRERGWRARDYRETLSEKKKKKHHMLEGSQALLACPSGGGSSSSNRSCLKKKI
jgi:mannitol-specific phosphotransferase system IIBC component